MMPRRLVFALLLLCVGCLTERDRLDIPTLSMSAIDTVFDGDRFVDVTVNAADGSGVVLVRATARSPFDTVVSRRNLGELRTVNERFFLLVNDTIRSGTPLEVEGQVVDNQNFVVSVVDTVVLR